MITLESNVKVRINFKHESESDNFRKEDLKLDWNLEVCESQEEMLKVLLKECETAGIAHPDQKSLIDFLMTILDGERVTAKVKQFMLMIENLTTNYLLKLFLKATGDVVYQPPLQAASKNQRKKNKT